MSAFANGSVNSAAYFAVPRHLGHAIVAMPQLLHRLRLLLLALHHLSLILLVIPEGDLRLLLLLLLLLLHLLF